MSDAQGPMGGEAGKPQGASGRRGRNKDVEFIDVDKQSSDGSVGRGERDGGRGTGVRVGLGWGRSGAEVVIVDSSSGGSVGRGEYEDEFGEDANESGSYRSSCSEDHRRDFGNDNWGTVEVDGGTGTVDGGTEYYMMV